ncbi:hypothetical protein [Streptococcus danieliae]|uniref:Uncharacterized protein n=1 Tax=Streptococcus danieliae TaxID=747656 RepID=A0A7X3G9W3_9STRE|nr:hypothetical protein [Streptococcus danieliae]MCU0082908.1 hypothetical protein [Streptococcus danieliae]MVX58879.1 hypothetical protein [Streptococcus danieliae]
MLKKFIFKPAFIFIVGMSLKFIFEIMSGGPLEGKGVLRLILVILGLLLCILGAIKTMKKAEF